MSDSDPLSRAKGSKFGCLSILGWVILAAALTVVLTLLLFWRMGAEVTQEARRMAESLASDFDKVFQFTPQISVDSVVVIAANTPVLELVTHNGSLSAIAGRTRGFTVPRTSKWRRLSRLKPAST
jgi:hypothetical protein